MAEPNKQTVQDLYDQAISQGIPEAEVINHISQFETPEHKSFLAQYHTNKAKEFGSVQKEPDMIDELVGAAKEHPGVAATAAVLPVAYYGAKAGIDYLTDIAKQKALNALEPSEAIKIQRDQLIDKEKQRAFEQAKSKETLEHQAELRRIELAKQNEQLTREQLRTQQLQSKAGVAPTAPATNVAPPTSTAPVTLPNAQATTPVATTSTPQEMANFATSGVTPNAQPAPVSPAQQVLKAETNPQPPVNPTSAIATTEPNPVVSGEGTSPLHNPEGQGLTQVEATSASATPNAAFPAETNTTKESGNLTNPAENPTQGGVEQIKKEVAPEKEVKGAAKPRRKPNEIPEGQVFKEGFGGADNWLQSAVGHDIRKFVRDTFNEGKPYGSGEDAMKKAYEHVNKYEQWLKENIPEQTYSRVERKAAGLPPPEIHGPLGTKAKIAGVAGLLMAASQASNAKELRNNLGEALLPLSATPTPVESGKLTSKQLEQYKEYGKLGSPYRQAFIQQTGGK